MDTRVTELHCIMPIPNIPSVIKHGILSNKNASKLPHLSVAMAEMQDRRTNKPVTNGYELHDYANLYFHARNPMLYKRKNEDVCVLIISTEVFKIPNAVITDQNAASGYVRFLSPAQHEHLDFDDIYAESWHHPDDDIRGFQHKSKKCAEVLIPNVVNFNYIIGAYVPNQNQHDRLVGFGFPRTIHIVPDFFFTN